MVRTAAAARTVVSLRSALLGRANLPRADEVGSVFGRSAERFLGPIREPNGAWGLASTGTQLRPELFDALRQAGPEKPDASDIDAVPLTDVEKRLVDVDDQRRRPRPVRNPAIGRGTAVRPGVSTTMVVPPSISAAMRPMPLPSSGRRANWAWRIAVGEQR